jgi:hypothetical protein
MRRLALFAAAAALAALAVPAAAQGAAGAAAAHRLTCGYLDDGNGAGSATSATPGTPPFSGEAVTQQNGGAWQVCYAGSSLSIDLFAAPGWCWAAPGGIGTGVVLKGCNGFGNQQWTVAGGNKYKNAATGGYLCASGGVGSPDITASSGNCSTYHSQWQSESSP